MSGEISKFLGFNKSTTNTEYQKMLSDKTQSLFGNNTTISMTELFKKDKSIFEAYKKLDNQGLSKFEEIISLDGDSSTINQVEYKTLLTVIDAEELSEDSPFLMDGKFEINDKSNGIYKLDTQTDIKPLYTRIKLQNKDKTEVLNDLKAVIDNQLYGNISNKTGNEHYRGCLLPIDEDQMAEAIFTIQNYYFSSDVKFSLKEAMSHCFGNDISFDYDENSWPAYTPELKARNDFRFMSTNLMGEPTVIDVNMLGNHVHIITSNGRKTFENSKVECAK